jgi:hypothetical protein
MLCTSEKAQHFRRAYNQKPRAYQEASIKQISEDDDEMNL